MKFNEIFEKVKRIKMVVFDVDGTLIPFKKEGGAQLSLKNKKAIEELKREGYKVVIASARDMISIDNLHKNKNIDYFIGSNGSFIYDCQKQETIWIDAIKIEDELIIKNVIKKEDKDREKILSISLHEHEAIFANPHDKLNWYLSPFEKHVLPIDDFVEKNKNTLSLITILTKDEKATDEMRIKLDKEFLEKNSKLRVQSWWSKGIFVANKGINKMVTIKKLAKMLEIEVDEIMAFGDGENDIEMLEQCGVGVVMANAPQNVLFKGDLIAPRAEEDGCYQMLKKLKMISKENEKNIKKM